MDDLVDAFEVQEKEFMEREQYLLSKLQDSQEVDKVVSIIEYINLFIFVFY